MAPAHISRLSTRATPLTGAATPTGQIASLPGRGMGGLA